MDEDEQASQAEGDTDKTPEPPRCGRHPSQLLTGICSSCLMERLSSVRDPPEAEIVEVAAEGSSGAADRGRLRKTLMLLFQLDDSTAGGAARPSEGGTQSAESQSVSAGGGPGRGGKRRGPGSWLQSIRRLPRGALRWGRNAAASAREPSIPPRGVAVDLSPHGSGGAHAERKPSFRRSCEWTASRGPSRGSLPLQPPRHSWDGSMVGRAFACSFACLEEREPPDGATRSNAEEAVGETRAAAAESTNGGHSTDAGGDADERRLSGRRSCDTGTEMAVSGAGRRRSNRWSRVWDRSITSPLKEFVRKGEHVLERSLSESRREVRRGKNAEAADMGGETQPGRNAHVPGRASQGSIRSSQAASNVDVHSFRTDWLKNSKIGRSRSVHYTSPGNLDNGMLRFYLTPMRSSRTANRGRRRSSRLFARGLFGFI